jgi:hypothetical protein
VSECLLPRLREWFQSKVSSKNMDIKENSKIIKTMHPFLEDCFDQLKSNPHYGCLASTLESDHQTRRIDYVVKQCELLFDLKMTVRGLGLGSKDNLPKSFEGGNDDWRSIQRLSGLEICQAWSLLLSAGHLFGSFGTERALVFRLERNLREREVFVRQSTEAGSQSQNVGRTFEKILDQGWLYSFFYLLALWRLREGGLSSLDKGYRNQARLLVSAYLSPPSEKIGRLKAVFRRARSLVYIQMHSSLSRRNYRLEAFEDADFLELFPADALPEADWLSANRWKVLESIDRDDAERLFGSTEAVAEMLRHVEQFDAWWAASSADFPDKVDMLFNSPRDWPEVNSKNLAHFIELRLPSNVGWLHEVRHWRYDNNQDDPWDGADFFISPTPAGRSLRVDLYAEGKEMPTKMLRHVLLQLARPFSIATQTHQDKGLWMSTARMIAAVFRSIIKPGYHLRLQPVPAKGDHMGYAVAGDTYEFVRARAKTFLAVASDQQRTRELRQLVSVADEIIGWRNPCMLMLASAELIRETEQGMDPCTDLDGVAAFFDGDKLIWLLVETKTSNSQNGGKQLRDNLLPALLTTSSEIEHRKFGADEAWFLTVESPAMLTLEHGE